ncbi:hypothetical protein GN956_G3098 [Arapaima gigas]
MGPTSGRTAGPPEAALLAAFTLIFSKPSEHKMVAQAREPSKVTCLQAGSSEAQNTLLSVNLRVAQDIGRQLAEIGDQLNQQWGSFPLPVWLRPLSGVTQAHFLVRTGLFRGILPNRRNLNAVPAVIQGRLDPLVHRHPGQAATGLAISVSCVRTNWAAGLLAAALLVMAAIWIDF